MSPIVPLACAALAALLLYGRVKRLARPQPSHWGDPRRRALAETTASALTVLFVGWLLTTAMAPAPLYVRPTFTALAFGVGLSQFIKSMRAPRALITVRR